MFKYKETYKVACSECGQEWQISADKMQANPYTAKNVTVKENNKV